MNVWEIDGLCGFATVWMSHFFASWFYLQDSNIMGHDWVSSGYLCRIMGHDKDAVILKYQSFKWFRFNFYISIVTHVTSEMFSKLLEYDGEINSGSLKARVWKVDEARIWSKLGLSFRRRSTSFRSRGRGSNSRCAVLPFSLQFVSKSAVLKQGFLQANRE